MGYTMMNTQVQMLMQQTETAIAVMMERGADAAELQSLKRFRSALQNPDLSRAQLAALLRRAARRQDSEKSQKTYWSAFMTQYVTRNANCNTAA